MHTIRRRRREGRTNYIKSAALLQGRLPRVVVRRSNRSITAQVIIYDRDGDKVVASAHSSELKEFNWPAKRNTPTAYLTGKLLARKAGKLNLGECVLDIGLRKPSKASILFAAAKGAADNGLKIKNNIEFDEKRIKGAHISVHSKHGDIIELFEKAIGAISR